MWYEYNEVKKKLVKYSYHFVADEVSKGKQYKVDIRFVVAVWEYLFENHWKRVENLIIFSDGCGRQWKLTKFSLYLMQLSNVREMVIDYHFFPSNHGQSICNVIGSVCVHLIQKLILMLMFVARTVQN